MEQADSTAVPPADGDTSWRRAIVYMAWGEKYLKQACENAKTAAFMNIPLVLITDRPGRDLLPGDHPFDHLQIIEAFRSYDMRAKSTLFDNLPPDFDSFLYLDTDTQILKDISFGFQRAERFGMALSPATSYCLPAHHDFRRIMVAAGLPDAGQMQYNAGIYFFVRRPDVEALFDLYQQATYELTDRFEYRNAQGKLADQPFLSYAMELLEFNPYTLTINYCYRGITAEPLFGDVVIWHSHFPVPEGINDPDCPEMKRPRYYQDQPIDMTPIFRDLRLAANARAAEKDPKPDPS